MRAYKYRLYPNKTQEALFQRYLDGTRYAYNRALALQNKRYQDHITRIFNEWGVVLTTKGKENQLERINKALRSGEFEGEVLDGPSIELFARMASKLTKDIEGYEKWRSTDEAKEWLESQPKPYLREGDVVRHIALWAKEDEAIGFVYAQTRNDVAKRLHAAFVPFFKGQRGKPRFKKADDWDSFKFPTVWSPKEGKWVNINLLHSPEVKANRIKLPASLGNVRVRMHRPLPLGGPEEGRPTSLTIKREYDKWFAIFLVKDSKTAPLPKTGEFVGIDWGVNPNFIVPSSGDPIPAPRFFYEKKEKLAKAQRQASKKRTGSKRAKEATKRVQAIHSKIARKREDFHWKTAAMLVRNYDLIVCEDLNIKGLSKAVKGTVEKPAVNRKQKAGLNRSILDTGWASFLNRLHQTASRTGKVVMEVPAPYTSQDCSACGEGRYNEKIGNDYTCPACGDVMHRDDNAARNILKKGLDALEGVKVQR